MCIGLVGSSALGDNTSPIWYGMWYGMVCGMVCAMVCRMVWYVVWYGNISQHTKKCPVVVDVSCGSKNILGSVHNHEHDGE